MIQNNSKVVLVITSTGISNPVIKYALAPLSFSRSLSLSLSLSVTIPCNCNKKKCIVQLVQDETLNLYLYTCVWAHFLYIPTTWIVWQWRKSLSILGSLDINRSLISPMSCLCVCMIYICNMCFYPTITWCILVNI